MISIFFPTLTQLIVTGILIISVVLLYFKHAFSYWKKKGVPFIEPTIITGNIGRSLVGKESIGEIVLNLYKKFRFRGYKHGGFYFVSSPVYVPLDPEVIKNILIKDFQHFMDRGIYYDEVREPLSAHLFALDGMKWKNLRAKLTPTFTSGKMKMMFQTITDCSDVLKEVCDDYSTTNTPIEIKEILARYTTDVIGSCAFGLNCNSQKNPADSEYRKMAKKFFDLNTFEAAKFFIAFGYPGLAKLFRFRIINEDLSHFFLKLTEQTINYRETNNINRNDFLQLLIQLKNKGHVDDEKIDKNKDGAITMNEAAAQAFVIFLGGSDTSSTAMTFCLFELAQNLELQEKLRQEVQSVLKAHDGKLTYEAIKDMKYMDMVFFETLRKYPPVMFLIRTCQQDYYIPQSNLTLDKGTMVYIPVFGIHKDPEYYPNPEKFDPDRFSEENRTNRHLSLFLPFGEGPRVCIGMRFGMMQLKIGLAVLLNRFKFTMNSKTKLPVKINEQSFVLMAKDPIWLNVNKI